MSHAKHTRRAEFEAEFAVKRANQRAEVRLQLVTAMIAGDSLMATDTDRLIGYADAIIDALERRRQEERDGVQKAEAAE